MTGGRWALLKVMTGQGAMSVHNLARRIGRDMKSVRNDVRALLNVGILNHAGDGRVVFPFDAVHVDFMLMAAT